MNSTPQPIKNKTIQQALTQTPIHQFGEIELGREKETQQPVYLPENERTYHTVIIGQTQYGKTSVLEHMVLEDLKSDRNAVLFDPHGDLTEDILLQAAATGKADKVLLYEITADSSYVFNPVEVKNSNDPMEVSRTVDSLIQVFRRHWTNYAWGPRVEWVLSNCLRTLVSNPGHTIDEIPLLLRDDAFRSSFLPAITNPQVQEFWRWYRTLESTRRPQDEWQLIESTLTRLSQFLANEWLVRILYQPVSTVDFSQIINNTAGQLTIFSLPIGRLGEEPAALLGSLLLGRLATTIFGRIDYGATLPRLHIYIDELSRFSLPITARLWTEGGKYNIGLTATLQTLSQLQDEENKSAVLQAGNHICFQCIGADATVLSQQMPIPDPVALTRPDPMLTYSANAIQEILDKGHPNPLIMHIRENCFWLFQQLQENRNKVWFEYPFFTNLDAAANWDQKATKWYLETWRSPRHLVEYAQKRLNFWFYHWMTHEYGINNKAIDPLVETLYALRGVFGIRMEFKLGERQDWLDYFTQKLDIPRALISPKELEQLEQWEHVNPTGNEDQLFFDAIEDTLKKPGQKPEQYPEKVKEFFKNAVRYQFVNYTSVGRPFIQDFFSLAQMENIWQHGNVEQHEDLYQIAYAIGEWETNNLYWTTCYLLFCAMALQKEPMHVPSRTYREVEYSRRTYADVRDELAQRLVSLPRYEAIAALVSEGKTAHIKTLPLPALSPAAQTGAEFIRNRSRQQVNKPMQEIMDALKKRTRPADPGNLPTPKPHI